MCLGCVAYDSAPTEYDRSVVLLTLLGLQAVEVAHVSSSWLADPNLVVPSVMRCACDGCRLRRRRRAQNGPWSHDLYRGRVIYLLWLNEDGERLLKWIRARKTQVAQTTRRISQVAQGLGMTWDGLSRWGPHFLQHRYGIDLENVCAWRATMKIYVDPPFPGSAIAWEDMERTSRALVTLSA